MGVYSRNYSRVKSIPLSVLIIGLCLSHAAAAACERLSVDTSLAVVRDTASGLTWSRCLVGQVGSGCFGDSRPLSWVDALNQARSAELAGISNWRLPKIEELQALAGIGVACLGSVFPSSAALAVWSASANLDYATDAWAFDFGVGLAVVKARDSRLRVLLVAKNPG
jgi:hypothetical protein